MLKGDEGAGVWAKCVLATRDGPALVDLLSLVAITHFAHAPTPSSSYSIMISSFFPT